MGIDYNILFRLQRPDAIQYLAENATEAVIQNFRLESPEQVGVIGGTGLPPNTFLPTLTGEAALRFQAIFMSAENTRFKAWRGLDVQHLNNQVAYRQGATRQYSVMEILATLWPASLPQPIFDFVTCRDIKGVHADVSLTRDVLAEGFTRLDDDWFDLIESFKQQMLTEAEPHRDNVPVGLYVMERTPLPVLDNEVVYDRMRLALMPWGIAGCLLYTGELTGTWYTPFVWTPEGTDTAQFWMHVQGYFALSAMLSCLWRDACIVRERFVEHKRGHKGFEPPAAGTLRVDGAKLVLPRTVYRSTWGAPGDRETVTRTAARAHAVRASYPRLQPGHQARDAEARAKQYHLPPPPPGRTFRAPHTRGLAEGEAVPEAGARQVVCRGLQVAAIVLGKAN